MDIDDNIRRGSQEFHTFSLLEELRKERNRGSRILDDLDAADPRKVGLSQPVDGMGADFIASINVANSDLRAYGETAFLVPLLSHQEPPIRAFQVHFIDARTCRISGNSAFISRKEVDREAAIARHSR